ncbi:MAG: exodeoxyribonuclease VII large subunit, partial [Burkholderiales bacterium]
LHDGLAAQATYLRRAVRQQLDRQAQRLDRAALPLSRPAQVVRLAALKLQSLAQQLAGARARCLERATQQLARTANRLQHAQQQERSRRGHALSHLGVRLAAVDPHQVLQRGYAWISDENGTAVQSVQAVHVQQHLHAVWADGRAQVQVTQIEPGKQEA